MEYKRLTLLCGHYGSGKTNIAVNMALDLRRQYDSVAVADLDIVNPYFRTKDSAEDFKEAGIRLIVSQFANTNLDLPSMPQDLYAITDDRSMKVVLDIGGDDRGALALGRIAPRIIEENDYDMLMVINKYRPLTPDAQSTLEVMREIEEAGKIRFTGIVNNSNLAEETTPEDVLASLGYAEEVSALSGLPVVMTTVKDSLYGSLRGKIDGLFPLTLQKKPIN
ncbi:MAG: hypothetical protein E7514_00775 [Ruminococcaceae bacterium]|nr:hypothetical protein [Oscillospiraceae bacterium]